MRSPAPRVKPLSPELFVIWPGSLYDHRMWLNRFPALWLLTALLCGGACRSASPLPPDDLSAPGWNLREGQAVWKTAESELAGELVLATRADGSSSLQFIKTPLPIVSAQTKRTRWAIRFFADDRTVSGRGTPPAQVPWLHVASALRGRSLPKPLQFKAVSGGNWELRNGETGESISGYLNP